jgi:3-phosphoshikimate 1-carboxyvinyltransferase
VTKTLTIYKPVSFKEVELNLPSSKSISNRALIIQAVSGKQQQLTGLSEADDTVLLAALLQKIDSHTNNTLPLLLDCCDGGTVARFLLAFLALAKNGCFVLTGSERLRQRPIKELVAALKSLGAHIKYDANEGFLPVRISPANVSGSYVEVDSRKSSQFVSALLLVAPALPEGLTVNVGKSVVSAPYIEMTCRLMAHYGVQVERKGNSLHCPPQNYKSTPLVIETDWSAAAFWYQAVALGRLPALHLKGLTDSGLQGDAVVAQLFSQMGVATTFNSQGATLSYNGSLTDFLSFDFTDTPDIFPPATVTAASLGLPARFTGLKTLSLKESDRITSTLSGLNKLGISVFNDACACALLLPRNATLASLNKLTFNSFNDHRIAMSFAMTALLTGRSGIANPDVVAKSYPNFFKDMETLGCEIITEIE